ncbi:hypothetical protein D1872_81310 [compost metagenome]
MDAKRIRKISNDQEKRTAKDLGSGRIRPGSGAFASMKGDAISGRGKVGLNSDDFLIENKFTFASKYILKWDIWKKIEMEALRENARTPAMQIDIAKGSGIEVQLVIMSVHDFEAWGMAGEFEIPEYPITITANSTPLHAESFYTAYKYNLFTRFDLQFENRGHLVVISRRDFLYFLSVNQQEN